MEGDYPPAASEEMDGPKEINCNPGNQNESDILELVENTGKLFLLN
jgi:hypothetical protein